MLPVLMLVNCSAYCIFSTTVGILVQDRVRGKRILYPLVRRELIRESRVQQITADTPMHE